MNAEDFTPKVSIVIPVYNGSNYLKEAIDSALAQTYKNIEIVVVNDGSNDEGATENIAKSYGDKIKYYSKENGGVASALNLGIEKMTGSYFSWLSHDDLYEKTKIEDQIEHLNKQANKDIIIACKAKTLFSSGLKKKEKIDKVTFKFIDIFLATSAMVGVNGCSLMIPKSAFEVCGDFNTDLPLTQDYELWFRMMDKYKFELLDKYLVISRRHAQQDSVQKQHLMANAVDELHYKFLNTIPYNRFEEYFNFDKKNIVRTYENYKTYRSRGYKKTPFAMLQNILRHWYENDRDRFYQVFDSEVVSDGSNDRKQVDLEYVKFLRSGAGDYPLKDRPVFDKPIPKTKVHRAARSLRESISRDGMYLTGEKVARKVHAKVTKSGR